MKNSNQPLVSVIIPTYGRAEMLCRSINSVISQTYINIEIIVVNDNERGSDNYESTMTALNIYKGNKKVKIISDGENIGGSLARNKGILNSSGDFISFLDDDDYYYEQKIEEQINFLIKYQADVCLCNMDILKKEKLFKDKRSYARADSIQSFLVDGNCFTPMIFCKKEILEEIGGFEKSPRFQDHILMLKILKANYKICILNKSLFVHNDHDQERITKNKLGSYDIRWIFEEKILDKLNKKQLKNYWFNRNISQIRMYRDNGFKLDALKLILLNLKNISSFFDIFISFRIILRFFFR